MNENVHPMMPSISRRALAVGAAAGLSLAAVRSGSITAGVEATPESGSTPDATPAGSLEGTPVTSGPAILVRVENIGGFVPPEISLTTTPTYQLTDDAREISQGAQILIYPPPALPSLQEATLTDEGIRVVVEAARAAGLADEDAEYINPNVTDLPNLVITVTLDGRTVTTTAYGLDFLDPTDTSELAAARDRIQGFLALIANPPSLRVNGQVATPESFYAFTELQIVAIQAVEIPAAGEIQREGDTVSTQPVGPTWPLETPLSAFGIPLAEATGGEGYAGIFPGGRVGTVSGADLEAVLPQAVQANQLSLWPSEGENWVLLLRPLLPGEVGDLARPANDEQAV